MGAHPPAPGISPGLASLLCAISLAALPSCAHRLVSASQPPPPADPCRGASFQLDEVPSACKAEEHRMPAPPEGALEIAFDSTSVTVASGETVTLGAELRNVTGEPLEVFLSPIGGYVIQIRLGDERVDESWPEGQMGGISAGVRPLRVVLEPGGVIRAEVPVSARVTTFGYEPIEPGRDGYFVVTSDGGPIPPGDYTLRIYPPLSGEHDVAFAEGWGSRPMVELPLRITP